MSNIPIISRTQNFVLNRKLLYIDSNDRDIIKYPNPAIFTIKCPQTYNNVESIRMLYIQTASNIYNISSYLQNNKLIINDQEITIENGYYTPATLANSIKNSLNEFTVDVSYCNVTNKIYFYSNDDFSLNFTKNDIYYPDSSCTNYNVYSQHSDWGLGAILGFEKKIYNSSQATHFLPSSNTSITNKFIISKTVVNINNNNHLYLKINRLNQSDTIKPFTVNINNGLINSCFSQIPILKNNENQSYNTNDYLLNNMSYFDPPIDRLEKLEFSFHYHNDMLADFQGQNIVLTLEINQIKNTIKDYDVRTPFKL